MNENLRVLRAEPRFARLLAASFISGIGDWFNTVAVLTLLLTLTGSGLAVGLTLALRVFPRWRRWLPASATRASAIC